MKIELLFSETARFLVDRLCSLVTPLSTNPRVIILGNQKSGTSAVAGLLALSTGATLTNDFVGSMYPYRRRPLTRLRVDRLIRANRLAFARDIVKEPNLTFLAGDLASLFPAAAFVFLERDPLENIRSTLDRVGWRPSRAQPFPPRRAVPNLAWHCILHGRDLELSGRSSIEVLAKRWSLARAAAATISDRAVFARYEEFLSDRAGFIVRLAQRCGLDPRNDVSEAAKKPFSHVGSKRGIDPREFFDREELAVIRSLCPASS